jgi:hypothetical protein
MSPCSVESVLFRLLLDIRGDVLCVEDQFQSFRECMSVSSLDPDTESGCHQFLIVVCESIHDIKIASIQVIITCTVYPIR